MFFFVMSCSGNINGQVMKNQPPAMWITTERYLCFSNMQGTTTLDQQYRFLESLLDLVEAVISNEGLVYGSHYNIEEPSRQCMR